MFFIENFENIPVCNPSEPMTRMIMGADKDLMGKNNNYHLCQSLIYKGPCYCTAMLTSGAFMCWRHDIYLVLFANVSLLNKLIPYLDNFIGAFLERFKRL